MSSFDEYLFDYYGMSKVEIEIYLCILNFTRKYHYSPTLAEIAKEIPSIQDRSGILYHLKKMREQKIINYVDNSERTITLADCDYRIFIKAEFGSLKKESKLIKIVNRD